MKRKTGDLRTLIDAIREVGEHGAEFICLGGPDVVLTVNEALEYLERLPEGSGVTAEDIGKWYECDIDGNSIIRTKALYGGLTGHETGVIVWNGSAEVFCGNWGAFRGLPCPSGSAETSKECKNMVAVLLDRYSIDDDTLDLAFAAARKKGDRTPSIHEVFKVNDMATVITFDGWP
jgi:hypothetical protein